MADPVGGIHGWLEGQKEARGQKWGQIFIQAEDTNY